MCAALIVTTIKMHLIFVILFVGGCTIKGTQSLTGWPPKPTPPGLLGSSCASYPPELSCKKDYQCGVGGSCEYVGLSKDPYMKYVAILFHL